LILALLATLGAMVVAFVLYPVFTATGTGGAHAALDETEIALSDLNDKKAMLYDAIQDLDFEKAAGKVSDADYDNARNDYLTQVAVVIEKIDALTPSAPSASPTQKSPQRGDGQRAKLELECASCGELNPKASNFCCQCGEPLTKTCASCGDSLVDNARFCSGCGEKVSA
jgi:membrane protease subunit (stomatin/prohibitin family)